ncbi:MAG: class I SAM-dependent methyltransferase [Caldilineae bacterium]|nr:class I SAM-dependent methyltransferase [Chloroflexota bacterium]MCB9175803.1 class I SAM-dependent methyltransferase [Caldilineae bacterium]
MSPQTAALLRFLVEALDRPVVAAPGEAEPLRQALAAGRATRETAVDTRASELAAGTGLVWLGAAEATPEPSAGRLYAAARADAFAGWPEACVVWLPEGRRGAAGMALAMAEDPPPAVLETLAAIDAASTRLAPTDPVPAPVGRLLYLLARARSARLVLDVGSSTGASLVWLAAAMRHVGGRVVGIERDSARFSLARRHLRRAGLDALAEPRLGEAQRLAAGLAGPFDLVFLDHDLMDRVDDLEALLPSLGPATLLVAHGGQGEAETAARFHALLQLHPGLRTMLRLPLGRDLALALIDGRHGLDSPERSPFRAADPARSRRPQGGRSRT